MRNELLFEIGTEEIPAGFLSRAVIDMEDIIRKSLTEKRIAFDGVRCLATPRRLVLAIADLAPRQEDQTIEKLGPARKAAFDENGQPTKAALRNNGNNLIIATDRYGKHRFNLKKCFNLSNVSGIIIYTKSIT